VITLAELNLLPAPEFVRTLAGIFEHSPWVPERASAARPFATREQLLEAMLTAVDTAAAAEQLALIRAHPTLGLRGRARATLTAASAREQSGAGLEVCTEAEAARLDALNAAYAEKFSMPFVVAVRGHTPDSIIAACERRLVNEAEVERRTALREIGLIAGFRLTDWVSQRGE
jgi:2-oxo-4-hydroxy-4-carboxy-5-ureidoimidazoline decarboxylase